MVSSKSNQYAIDRHINNALSCWSLGILNYTFVQKSSAKLNIFQLYKYFTTGIYITNLVIDCTWVS